MLEKIVDTISKAVNGNAYEYASIISIALPVLVCLIISLFGGGKSAKIRRGFKKVIKKSKTQSLTLKECCALVHKTVSDKISLAQASGELPGEYATHAVCVSAQCEFSPKRNCGAITLGVTSVAFTLSLMLGLAVGSPLTYWVPLLTITVGGISSLVGLIVSKAYVKRLSSAYETAMTIIDNAYIEELSTTPRYAETEVEDFEELEAEESVVEDYPYAETATVEEVYETTVTKEPTVLIEEENYEPYDEYIDAYEEETAKEPEKEDVVQRVEQIALYGATIEEMKEVATLLKLERAKPENCNPTKKKILDDAFASLLRSIGSARK